MDKSNNQPQQHNLAYIPVATAIPAFATIQEVNVPAAYSMYVFQIYFLT